MNDNSSRYEQPPRTLPPPHYRRDTSTGFYLPLWSIALMMLCVFACAGSIVFSLFALGGNAPAQLPPVILVDTVAPTLIQPAAGASVTLTDTRVVAEMTEAVALPEQGFVLVGPTLPPIVLTPTPGIIDVGVQVRVVDVGDQQLNVRDAPGVNTSNVVFRVPEGIAFTVVGGPQQADGLTWWQIALVENSARVGWAASNYLEYAAP